MIEAAIEEYGVHGSAHARPEFSVAVPEGRAISLRWRGDGGKLSLLRHLCPRLRRRQERSV